MSKSYAGFCIHANCSDSFSTVKRKPSEEASLFQTVAIQKMLCIVSLVILLFGSTAFCQTVQSINSNAMEIQHLNMKPRFFPLFSVVRFANSQCLASNNLNGTCFTRRECRDYGGTASGTCASGHGICCVFQKTCGSTTNVNNTYFTNPEYPTTYDGTGRCTITVNRCNSNICQLRLDFLEFNLASPNASGVCDFDLFLASGSSTSVPRICGENANQHVYIDFNGGSPIMLSIDTNSEYSTERRWNIRIQQIPCDATYRAPNGCLQYFTSVSDTVTSFNYGTTQNPRAPTYGTRQMANTNYGVCVRMAQGYCGIEWSQTTPSSFSVSGDTGSFDSTIIGTEFAAEAGTNCTKDFVIIPHPFQNGIPVGVERFCGNGFVTKTSFSKPFVMYVVTNGDEIGEIENKGFSLTYRQTPCSVF
ncbi:uncharacterized protein LOC128895856 [Hylaeus anthracinus]|uniref:uncharacterized protein LOC128895856 n=1 Tax=Hylaeus anthracinus TaxID=313031 RepID=UPI0023BA0BB6|nr:uncharacterized protein LOC128895856 [Hylaeus anthracinus]